MQRCESVTMRTMTPLIAAATPSYNTSIPGEVMTPDTVQTRIGTLTFVDGVPTPGPDARKGGKYLIVPESFKGDAGGYFVARSPSYMNRLILRGFLVDGKPDAAAKMSYNTIHANTFALYKELDAVIQEEPVEFIDPELRGLAASIGIRKGTPFAPDERMKKTLTEAVAVANGTARARCTSMPLR